MGNPQLEFKDRVYFDGALEDQDSLMMDIEIRRCIGINANASYPGDKPEILRNSIFVRAEVKPIALGEVEAHGGIQLVSDLNIRSWFELRGTNQKDWEYGDKVNPSTIADIILLDAPYQGEWYVVGVPEAGVLVAGQDPMFWNVNIRRIKRGALGKS
jgi:hypothetical protein